MKFDKRVKQIASAEKDVDKVLRAARLARHENPRMSDYRFDKIMELLTIVFCTAIGCGTFLGFLWMMVLARG